MHTPTSLAFSEQGSGIKGRPYGEPEADPAAQPAQAVCPRAFGARPRFYDDEVRHLSPGDPADEPGRPERDQHGELELEYKVNIFERQTAPSDWTILGARVSVSGEGETRSRFALGGGNGLPDMEGARKGGGGCCVRHAAYGGDQV